MAVAAVGDAALVPARDGVLMDPLYRVPGASPRHVPEATCMAGLPVAPTLTSDEHARQVDISRVVLHQRPRTTGEIQELLRRSRIVLELADLEAALICAPGVVQVAPGLWRRG